MDQEEKSIPMGMGPMGDPSMKSFPRQFRFLLTRKMTLIFNIEKDYQGDSTVCGQNYRVIDIRKTRTWLLIIVGF
jgi:hypothetical protein